MNRALQFSQGFHVHVLDRHDVGLILLCSGFFYVNLFTAGTIPFLLGGDQVFFWLGGQRLLYGEQIYRDFYQFTPPGIDFIYRGAFTVFGPWVWTTNLVVLILGAALSTLCMRLAKSIMPRPQAALATCLFTVFIYGTTLNGTHHWFSVLAVTGATAVLMHSRSVRRIAIAGALLGLATFFTQTRGPVAAVGIAGWMMVERYRTQQPWSSLVRALILLFLSLIVTWFALSSYYIATQGLRQLWALQITDVHKYVASGWNLASIGLPQNLSKSSLLLVTQSLFAYVALPCIYVSCSWSWWKLVRENSPDAAPFGVLVAIGAAMLAEVAVSPSWLRIFAVSLPGVILSVWLVGRSGRFHRYTTNLLWVCVVLPAAGHTGATHVHNSVIADLPAGKIATSPTSAEKLAWLASHTKSGEFMLQAQWPGMYLPLALRNPIFLDIMAGAGTSRVENVERSVQQLDSKHVRYIVMSPRQEKLEQYPEFFRHFLTKHYRRVWIFSDGDEVWERETCSVQLPTGTLRPPETSMVEQVEHRRTAGAINTEQVLLQYVFLSEVFAPSGQCSSACTADHVRRLTPRVGSASSGFSGQ